MIPFQGILGQFMVHGPKCILLGQIMYNEGSFSFVDYER